MRDRTSRRVERVTVERRLKNQTIKRGTYRFIRPGFGDDGVFKVGRSGADFSKAINSAGSGKANARYA
jgi:hypothetical protein